MSRHSYLLSYIHLQAYKHKQIHNNEMEKNPHSNDDNNEDTTSDDVSLLVVSVCCFYVKIY